MSLHMRFSHKEKARHGENGGSPPEWRRNTRVIDKNYPIVEEDPASGEPTVFGGRACDHDCNPFEYNSPVTLWEQFKMVFFTVTLIAPLRILVFSVLVFIAYLLSLLSMLGMSREDIIDRPMPWWRRKLLLPVRVLCRVGLFVFGFYKINVKGSIDPRACIITPNHCSMFDLLAMYWLALPSAVSKAEILKLPLIGTIFRALQVVPVKRNNEEDRENVKKVIARFAASRAEGADPKWRMPPILIFPQGTTTQQSVLTMFQRGAFVPGQPVQPVALNYTWKHFNPAFVVNRKTDWYLFRHLTQFVMHLEINFLPLHFPTEVEIADPTLFANTVRCKIAHQLGSVVTNHTFEDAVLYRCALNIEEKRFKLKSTFQATDKDYRIKLHGLEVRQLKDMFDLPGTGSDAASTADKSQRFTLADAKLMMQKFAEADKNGDGLIDLDEFAEATGYSANSEQSRRLFKFFDRDHSGKIDFKELAVGMAVCNPYSTCEERVKFAFDVYDENNDGFVSEMELRKLLKFFNEGFSSTQACATERQVEDLLRLVKRKRVANGLKEQELLISWDEFQQYVPKESKIVATALLSINERAHQLDKTGRTSMRSNRLSTTNNFFPDMVK